MRRFFLISSFLTLFAIGSSAQWKPAGDKIKTDWASQINPANVLPEYPRPIMERSDWKNLNGLWNYAVINKGEHLPAEFEEGHCPWKNASGDRKSTRLNSSHRL